tara:strand:- start:6233 stop:6928 length:696 start_codon:yes stop_codon:yes gene_type:complete
MKLTIIIPIYNEINTIDIILKKIFNLKINKQIIVVDDASVDGTKKKILNYKKKIDKIIFHKKNLGKGGAIKSAKKFIKGDMVIIQDADLEYNPKDYKKMINYLKKNNFKVLYGSRVLNKNAFQNLQNFSHVVRIWGNLFLTSFSNIINKQNLTDAHTCYKLFDAKIFKKINLKENGFSFCPEVTTKLSNMNIKIHETEINYKGRTYEQGKKIKATDGVHAIYTILKYKFFN